MDNADAPIRYRVVRELTKDKKVAKKIEPELLENKEVQKWLAYLKPHDPPQHRGMEHGCFDFCLENALPKLNKEQNIIVVCASGMRSRSAVNMMKKSGFANCYNGGSWINFNE